MTKVDAFGNIIVLSDEEAGQEAAIASENDQRIHTNQHTVPSYASSLTFWSNRVCERKPFPIIGQLFLQMAKALLNPGILFALAASSMVLGINICESLSFGGILENSYGWPAANTGLIYLGAIPAGLFAFFSCGFGGDYINTWLARRNGGVHIPEHRLPALIFPAATGVAAAIMYGFCAESAPNTHWFSIVFSVNYCTYAFICVLIVSTT